MRNKFDMQLENLSTQLINMGSLCEKAIANVAKAIQKGDLELARLVMKEDEEIDQMEKDIERLCLKLLLQQQPVARDLRQISAALKMITDMERIGDQTSDIADIIIAAGMSEAREIPVIGKMAEATSKMVNDSVLAYVNKDLELARKVMLADDEVDKLFDQTKQKLVKSGRKSNRSDYDHKIFGAYRRPCDKYCRMGRIFYHRCTQRNGSCIGKDKGESRDDILCRRRWEYSRTGSIHIEHDGDGSPWV